MVHFSKYFDLKFKWAYSYYLHASPIKLSWQQVHDLKVMIKIHLRNELTMQMETTTLAQRVPYFHFIHLFDLEMEPNNHLMTNEIEIT